MRRHFFVSLALFFALPSMAEDRSCAEFAGYDGYFSQASAYRNTCLDFFPPADAAGGTFCYDYQGWIKGVFRGMKREKAPAKCIAERLAECREYKTDCGKDRDDKPRPGPCGYLGSYEKLLTDKKLKTFFDRAGIERYCEEAAALAR